MYIISQSQFQCIVYLEVRTFDEKYFTIIDEKINHFIKQKNELNTNSTPLFLVAIFVSIIKLFIYIITQLLVIAYIPL